jgi:hypothetical protein
MNHESIKQIMNRFLRIVLLAAAIVCSGTSGAQNNDRQRLTREQLAEMQARHIAREMAMDDATRRQFIETYCQYQAEIWALGPRNDRSHRPTPSAMTDAETEQAIKERFERSQRILNIRQAYYAKYSEFLTQPQIRQVYELERQMMIRLAKHKKNRSSTK